jgi:dihydroorotase/N-acyl-D-amino-acid deacylase
MFDLVIEGGQILDGSGAPPRHGDVAVAGERIAAAGDLASPQARRHLDATGLMVAPGFIDAHAHTDLAYLLGPQTLDLQSAGLRQGVTTEVCGNCGFSPFPAATLELDPHEPYRALFPASAGRYYPTLTAYRSAIARPGLPLNLAPLVGHGRIRAMVMRGANRPAHPGEVQAMATATDQALAEGAFGLSSGLAYSPGSHATTDEMAMLAARLRSYGLPYVSHIRDEGDHAVAAVAEAIQIGRSAGVSVHISHHKLAGRRNWGTSSRTLAMINEARAGGVDVTLDAYPYTAGSTLLADLLPPWILADSASAAHDRLRDGSALDRLEHDFQHGLPGWQNLPALCGWDKISLAGQRWPGRPTIADVAATEGMSEARLVAEILHDDMTPLVIIEMMDEAEVTAIASEPYAMVGSDGIPVAGGAHPRIAGTFARTLAAHSASPRALAAAVRRMTMLPAERFRIPDRGLVAPQFVADLVVFDAGSVHDRATYAQPLLPPAGIQHVFVAGQQVLSGGKLTGIRPGRVLAPG